MFYHFFVRETFFFILIRDAQVLAKQNKINNNPYGPTPYEIFFHQGQKYVYYFKFISGEYAPKLDTPLLIFITYH